MLLFPPWKTTEWRRVDDSVRGGASVSRLEQLDRNKRAPKEHVACFAGEKNDDGSGVLFSGTLDIKALGGAGFASQRFTYESPLNLRGALYSGVQLCVVSMDLAEADDAHTDATNQPRCFTLTIATTPSQKRSSGRTASRVNWEAEFELPVPAKGRVGAMLVELPFNSFVATYRGRPLNQSAQEDESSTASTDEEALVGESTPKSSDLRFKTEHIHEIGIMCRSNFGTQQGAFCLGLMRVEAIERQGLVAWMVRFWVWLMTLLTFSK